MIILDKYTDGAPTVDLSKGEDFKSVGLQIDFECTLAIYDLSHVEYIAETKAIEAYTEASGVESLYTPQFKVLIEEANEGFKAKFTNVMGKIRTFFTEMWQRFSNWINRIFVSDEKMIKKIEKNISDYAPKKLTTIDHAKCIDILSDIRKDAEDAYSILNGEVGKIEDPEKFEEVTKKAEDLFNGFREGAKLRGDKSYKDGLMNKFKETISEKEIDPKNLLQVYKDALNTFKTFNEKTFSSANLLLRKIGMKAGTAIAKNMVDEKDREGVEKSGKQFESDIILICKEVNNCMTSISACISYLYNTIRSDFNKLVKGAADTEEK